MSRLVRAALAIASVLLAPAAATWLTLADQHLAAVAVIVLVAVHALFEAVAWHRRDQAGRRRYEQAARSGAAHLLDQRRPQTDARVWADLERWGTGDAR